MSEPRANWFREELARAKSRIAELPLHARPVAYPRKPESREWFGCHCGHPGAGCVCHEDSPC